MSSFSLTSQGSGWKSWICTGATMQPLTLHGTILKHQCIQDMDSFFRIPNMQLGIYREMKKNPCDTSFTGFDLLERSFRTQRKFQNSKSSIINVSLSLVRANLTPEHLDHKSHQQHSWVLITGHFVPPQNSSPKLISLFPTAELCHLSLGLSGASSGF